MGRLGVQPEEAVAFAGQALAMPGLTLDGVFSHLANGRRGRPGLRLVADRPL
ncbi:MAG: alanine racemase [Anaerolineae bacterium]